MKIYNEATRYPGDCELFLDFGTALFDLISTGPVEWLAVPEGMRE